jgi:hypothetical protein
MKRIPRSTEVNKAFVACTREIKTTLREINQQASKLLSRGDYSAAEAEVEVARTVQGFLAETEALRKKWSSLRREIRGEAKTKPETTPLWEYYQPILQAMVDLGGTATRDEIISHLASSLPDRLKPGDLRPMAKGRPRWHVMVRRARKAMIKEDYLEDQLGRRWIITDAGRRVAKSAVS